MRKCMEEAGGTKRLLSELYEAGKKRIPLLSLPFHKGSERYHRDSRLT